MALIDCGNGVRSAFNDYSEAMNYGQWRSAVSGGRTEISNKHGDLVGQYSAGKTTPEFSSHHVSAGAPAYALDGG